MEGMGLKFIPVIGRCLLCHLSMFRPMAGTSTIWLLIFCGVQFFVNLVRFSYPQKIKFTIYMVFSN